MMSPIISIIVPCYNQAQYLSEALESVLAQTMEDWECVIVNDGSTDNTLKIANEWAEKDNRFIVIDKENGGPSDARNVGIRASHGKYILPLDADDKIASTYLAKAVDYLENHHDTKLVYCLAEFFDGETGPFVLPDYEYEKMLWQNLIFCSAVYRRSDYDKTDGYNTNMKHGFEDWDFWLSLLAKRDKVFCIPEVDFWYRKHGESRATNAEKWFDDSVKQLVLNHIEKYQPFFSDMINARRKVGCLEKEIDSFRNSTSFRLGYAIISRLNNIMEKLK